MLLVGMAHDSSLKRNLVLAVPRVGLALILGVVIATPLTLQVFSKEIDTEIVTMQAEAADAYRASLDSDDARFADLPELRERIATAEAIVASGGRGRRRPRGGAAEVTAAQAALDAALATARDARGEGAVRAGRHVRHRRRREREARTWRRGRRPTRRRRSWPRRAPASTTPSMRRRLPRRAALAGRLVAGRPTGRS